MVFGWHKHASADCTGEEFGELPKNSGDLRFNYQCTINGKKYHLALTDDLRSAGSIADRLWIDISRRECWVEKKISIQVINGSENWIPNDYGTLSNPIVNMFLSEVTAKDAVNNLSCSHLPISSAGVNSSIYSNAMGNIAVRLNWSIIGAVESTTTAERVNCHIQPVDSIEKIYISISLA